MIYFLHGHMAKKILKTFMKDFTNFKSNLKFTFECNRNSIKFLSLYVKVNWGKLTTSVCIKPTDRHQYLHYRSLHPDHIKLSIVYRRTSRANRLGSLKKIL